MQNATLPFTFTVEGVGYTTVAMSTNGWLELGGNTAGNSDPTNDCLPTAAHTHPFIAPYWDDMQTAGSSSVQYGVVGSSPNRVFLADFFLDTKTSGDDGADDIQFQVQLHERSNTVTVRYRGSENLANGQNATIGFQGAGGASATAVESLGCNGKILDDNRDEEGWSADVGRAGYVTLSAVMQHSPDDLSGFPTLTGNDNVIPVSMPFSVTLDGASYSTIAISTNGWIEFGGNTSGNSDPTNDCLPTSAHTNPFLAAYWDDLNPFGTTVRYGSVGASPNRVYIVDFEEDLNAGSEGSDDFRMQVQIHERSNLINVRYWDKQSGAHRLGRDDRLPGRGRRVVGRVSAQLQRRHPRRQRRQPRGLVGAAAGERVRGAARDHRPQLRRHQRLHEPERQRRRSRTRRCRSRSRSTASSYTTVAISTNGWLEFGGNTAGDERPEQRLPADRAHTNPFLALLLGRACGPSTPAIRYGTVGSSGNRTFIVDVDFENDTGRQQRHDDAGAAPRALEHDRREVHARVSRSRTGRPRRSAFRAPAARRRRPVAPLTCNGKILDDNRGGAGWSVTPLPICGNGLVESRGNEVCDLGAGNGSGTTCCTASCTLVGSGTLCRAPGGVCDVADNCTGAEPQLPGRRQEQRGLPPERRRLRPRRVVRRGRQQLSRRRQEHRRVPRLGRRLRRRGELRRHRQRVSRRRASSPRRPRAGRSAGVCDLVDACPGSGPTARRTPRARPSAGRAAASATSPRAATASATRARPIKSSRRSTVCRASGGVCDVTENCDGAARRLSRRREEHGRVPRRRRRLRRRRELRRERQRLSGGRLRGRERRVPGERRRAATSPRPAPAAAPRVPPTASRRRAPSAGRAPACATSPRAAPAAARTVPPTPSSRRRRVCRPDAGQCDVADTCTGTRCRVSRATGSSPTARAATTPTLCTNADQCVAGACTGDSLVCGDGTREPSCN